MYDPQARIETYSLNGRGEKLKHLTRQKNTAEKHSQWQSAFGKKDLYLSS